MCQNCVNDGTMTQEELGGMADSDDIAALLKRMIADQAEDPDAKASRQMDAAVKAMLDLMADAIERNTPSGADEVATMCQSLAGQLMFSSSPAAIAYLATVLTYRMHHYIGVATPPKTPPAAPTASSGGMYI